MTNKTLDTVVEVLTETPAPPVLTQKQLTEAATTPASCAYVDQAVGHHEATCKALRTVKFLLVLLLIGVSGLAAANAVFALTLRPTIRETVRQVVEGMRPHASAPSVLPSAVAAHPSP